MPLLRGPYNARPPAGAAPHSGGRRRKRAGLELLLRNPLFFLIFAVRVSQKFCRATIKKNFRTQWNDKTSKLLSVISINGFIIALTRQLSINGVQNFDFYDNTFNGWEFDFSKEKFPYTSSQYRKFSTRILEEAFKIDRDVIDTI